MARLGCISWPRDGRNRVADQLSSVPLAEKNAGRIAVVHVVGVFDR